MATTIAPSKSSNSLFPLFTRLPPELRNQIWQDSLPFKIGPHLFLYEKGAWGPYHLTETDREYDAENDELNWEFRWHHDSLHDKYFNIPLFFVNREARGIAFDWIHKHGIDTRTITGADNKPHRAFVRCWDPLRDALYVPLGLWNRFLDEPRERFWQSDTEGYSFTIKGGICHLAVPETLLSTDHDIASIFEWYYETIMLYIVLDPPPDLDATESDGKTQPRRWEFEDANAGAYIYNHELGKFGFVQGESRCHEPLYKMMEDIANVITAELIKGQTSRTIFEIRPVIAIEK